MFERLGRIVSRHWAYFLSAWIIALVALLFVAPKWEDVIYDGEFKFLPENFPSRQAETLFHKAFPNQLRGSSIVIVARRESGAEGLTDDDKSFIDDKLVPQLAKAVGLHADDPASTDEQTKAAAADEKAKSVPKVANADKPNGKDKRDAEATPAELIEKWGPVVTRIRTFSDKEIGQLLVSDDQKATLIMLELKTDYTELWNVPTIAQVEKLIGRPGQPGILQREKGFPKGLDLTLSGSATVGRDMREAGRKSARATESATILLVIVLLFAIYRAPILAIIPLLTVYISVRVALLLLALMAKAGWVHLFVGIEVYVTVVLYGAGVDYCMFLMSRYKEELDNGATFDEAMTISVGRVGHALAFSAGTVMCGIFMMVFTQFGKLQQAGIAMSFSLIFVLAAALTLTPAILRFAGRWTFWPRVPTERLSATQGWISPTSALSRLLEREWFGQLWDKVGHAIVRRPGTIWLASVALMMPFVVVAIAWRHNLSYGLLSELPANEPSVIGAAAVEAHFPAGITGPVTILLENRSADFNTDNPGDEKKPGWQQVQAFVESLYDEKTRKELGILDVASVAFPLGMSDRVKTDLFKLRLLRKRAQSQYVSEAPGLVGQVTKIDVIMNTDPFSRDSMESFDRLRQAAPGLLPKELQTSETRPLEYLGATASIRDLKTVTGEDQARIDILVPAVVFVILVLLLKRVATSAYLIVSVFFSYLVTLGVTFVVFWLFNRHGFAGLDWKVPMFLFTILVAVGEDYNILLMARIEEEQHHHGPVQGILVGLRKTGGIISSCGIIMAGTFSALMAGYLEGLVQLGFALAFGVLLDTFVVRPVLVPAYLILLHEGFFGPLGHYLGADDRRALADEPAPAIGRVQVASRRDGERGVGGGRDRDLSDSSEIDRPVHSEAGSKSSGSDAERVAGRGGLSEDR